MPRDDRFDSFQFYISDWRASERVRSMSLAERGVYVELLLWCYEVGSLPSDRRLLADCARCSPQLWNACKDTVLAMFTLRDGRYYHDKVTEQRDKVLKIRTKLQANGKAGGQASAQARAQPNGKASSEPIAQAELDSRAFSVQYSVQSSVQKEKPSVSKAQEQSAKISFEPNCERFDREFWKVVSDLDMQNFISQVRTADDEKLFFQVLTATKSAEGFDPKFSVSAEKWLTTGLWRKMPKNGKPDPEPEPKRAFASEHERTMKAIEIANRDTARDKFFRDI